ncbi:hypothetical protein [Oscillibacter sp.]|uniref:hypothetical protein n=1 Tax=Oscillibacter sp. TaxID=1945593 RepID=UPI0028A71877|nr:hypothetical protein [Oscillibacter sp.]
MAEISISFKASENVSQVMLTITSSAKLLSKELEELERRGKTLRSENDKLQKKFGLLNEEIITVRDSVKEAEKVFKMTGDTTDGIELSNAVEEYERLVSAINETKDASGTMTDAIKSNADEMKKLLDKATQASGGVESGESMSKDSEGNLVTKLAKTKVFENLGNSVADMAGTLVGSALGESTASAVGKTLSGTLSGVAAGASLGIPGMIAGGIIGTFTGGLNALNESFKQQDDAFKEYYKNLYETGKAKTAEDLKAGITIAISQDPEYEAKVSALDSTLNEIKSAGGKGYIEERQDSIDASLNAYDGVLGDKLAELSAVGGTVQAYGENMQDQYQLEALSALLLGEKTTAFTPEDAAALEKMRAQYQAAEEDWNNGSMEAGQEMTRLKEQAEALATTAFESSEWSEKLHEAELDQIEATRNLTAGMSATTRQLEISNEFSKGLAGSGDYETTGRVTGRSDNTEAHNQDYTSPSSGISGRSNTWDNKSSNTLEHKGSRPFGLQGKLETERNLLHQDETVKKAAKSRAEGGASGLKVEFTGPITVRKDSDLNEVADRIYKQLLMARLRAEG